MARPREFDEKAVLDRALSVFWAKGFEGTSVQDLVDATRLSRASLYGAFGDKERLYARVIEHYVGLVSQKSEEATLGAPEQTSTREALDALLSSWLGTRCELVAARGCFLALAGTESEADESFAREALVASIKDREARVRAILVRGRARGDLPKDRDPAVLARTLIVLVQGIAGVARVGWSAQRLRSVIDQALDLVTG